jgi:Ca2+-binding EF-hand superfamily protein
MFKSRTSTFLDKLIKYEELGRKPKDIIAVAESRTMAEEIKQNVIDQLDIYDHNNTGTLENSIGVRPLGNGEFGVTAAEYAKYVNGYDREKTGTGFVDDAVNQALLDIGQDAEVNI